MQHELFHSSIAVLDCDGVLADFVSATLIAHGRPETHCDIASWNYFDDWGMSTEEFWAKCSGYEFWRDLDPYPWAHDFLGYIKSSHDEFVICTAPSNDPSCVAAKIDWLAEHFKIKISDIFVGQKKYLLAGPGRHLIDDNIHNCRAFVEAGGQASIFRQPWNFSEEFEDEFVVDAEVSEKEGSFSDTLGIGR